MQYPMRSHSTRLTAPPISRPRQNERSSFIMLCDSGAATCGCGELGSKWGESANESIQQLHPAAGSFTHLDFEHHCFVPVQAPQMHPRHLSGCSDAGESIIGVADDRRCSCPFGFRASRILNHRHPFILSTIGGIRTTKMIILLSSEYLSYGFL
jgi:hypothetical protein